MKQLLKVAAGLLLSVSAAQAQIYSWTTNGDKVGNSDITSMVWLNSYSPADMVAAATKLKAKPAGKRCLFLSGDTHSVFNDPADKLSSGYKSLWWPTGIAKSITQKRSLIAQLKSAGVTPDLIVLDNEDGPNRWILGQANINAIAADPRGRAMGVAPLTGDEAGGLAFDAIAGAAATAAIRQGIFQPLMSYAPNATYAQFGDFMCSVSDGTTVSDINGHAFYKSYLCGTVQDMAVYGSRGIQPITQTPYGDAVYSENTLRITCTHGSEWPWYSGDGVDKAAWAGTNYWSEFVRHGLLTCGLQGFLFDADQPQAANKFAAVYADTKTAVAGKMPTTLCSTSIIDPAQGYFVTARADDWNGVGSASRIVGRVTFAPGVTSATFTVAGQTFTVTPAAGQAGAWFSYKAATNTGSTTTSSGTGTTTTTKKKTVTTTPASVSPTTTTPSASSTSTGGSRAVDPIRVFRGR